jgi:hypothetical protein
MRAFGWVWRRIIVERRNAVREVGRIEPDLEIDAVRSWDRYGTCSMEMDEPIRRRFHFIVLRWWSKGDSNREPLSDAFVNFSQFEGRGYVNGDGSVRGGGRAFRTIDQLSC